jgi:hypothetical protein
MLLLGLTAVGLTACGAGSAKSSSAASPATVAGRTGSPHRAAEPESGAASAGGAPSGATGASSSPESQTVGASVAPATADIVEDGTLAVTVRSAADLRSSYADVATLAGAEGGFVSASTLTDSRYPRASVTVRVPNSSVHQILGRIGAMGHVTSQTLTGRDVTGQVIDLSVQITNLTSEENAVRKLLANAGTVGHIITVQQQLFQLQDEIQQLQAQSNSLDNRIRYATIAVQLSTVAHKTPVHHHRRHRASTVARFWHLASSHSVGVVRGVFLAIGWAAPALLALAVAGLGWLGWRRRRTPSRPVTAEEAG